MWRVFVRFYFSSVALLAVGCAFLAPRGLGQAQNQAASPEESVDKFMQNYLGPPSSDKSNTRRYFSASVDLKDDGTHEVIVYVLDAGFCGSGGCTTLILTPKDSSYRTVTKITIARLPIRVLATKSNGWHDLGIWVQGGGIQHGYEAKLSFNGMTYPSNPPMPPARRLTRKVAGKVVVSSKVLEKLVK